MCTERTNLLNILKENYADIVKEVKVKGYILDKMFACNIIGAAFRREMEACTAQDAAARSLVDHILTSSDLRAPFSFLESLQSEYEHLATNLKEKLTERSSEGESVISSSSLLAYSYYHFAS